MDGAETFIDLPRPFTHHSQPRPGQGYDTNPFDSAEPTLSRNGLDAQPSDVSARGIFPSRKTSRGRPVFCSAPHEEILHEAINISVIDKVLVDVQPSTFDPHYDAKRDQSPYRIGINFPAGLHVCL